MYCIVFKNSLFSFFNLHSGTFITLFMKKIFTLCFFALVSAGLFAQIQTKGIFGYGNSDFEYNYSLVQNTDSGIVAAGASRIVGQNYNATVSRYNSFGEYIWNKKISYAEHTKALEILRKDDDNYYALIEKNVGLDGFALMKFNGVGDTLWTRAFGSVNGAYPRGAALAVNSNILVLNRFTINYEYGFNVTCFSPQGDTLWTRGYKLQNYWAEVCDLVATSDGGFAVLGNVYAAFSSAMVAKFDENGVNQWTSIIEHYDITANAGHLYPEQFSITNDGGYIITGNFFSDYTGAGYDVFGLKIDATGSVQWIKSYSTNGYDTGASVMEDSDGNFIFIGSIDGGPFGLRDAISFSADPNGNILWSYGYGKTNRDYATAIIENNFGGYIIAGYSNSFSGLYSYQSLLSGIDHNGRTYCSDSVIAFVKTDLDYSTYSDNTMELIDTAFTSRFDTLLFEDIVFDKIIYCEPDSTDGGFIAEIFQYTRGGEGTDYYYGVNTTMDQGYIMCGETDAFSGTRDILFSLLDKTGNVVWDRVLDGGGTDVGYDIKQSADGGFVFAGTLNYSLCVGKLNHNGNLMWIKSFSNAYVYQRIRLDISSLGNITVVGAGSGGQVIRLNKNGDFSWQKNYSINSMEEFAAVKIHPDGGFVIAGSSNINGSDDVFVIRTTWGGDTLWTKHYGGSESEMIWDIAVRDNGNILFAGRTASSSFGGNDIFLMCTDSQGDTLWTRRYGGDQADEAFRIMDAGNDEFLVCGYQRSFSAGVYDGFLMRVDTLGNIIWSKTYGSEQYDAIYGVSKAADNGYMLVGRTMVLGAGGNSGYIIKTDSLGNAGGCQDFNTVLPSGPANISVFQSPIIVSDQNFETIGVIVEGDPDLSTASILISLSSEVQNTSCHFGSDGGIDITPFGGTSPYNYQWSSGAGTQDLNLIQAGTYTLTVTDDYGCSVIDTIKVEEPDLLVAITTGFDVSCYGGNDGSAVVTPVGGTPPYTYYWNVGQITSQATNLYPGTYTINVVDNQFCGASGLIQIGQPLQMEIEMESSDVLCYNGNDGQAGVSVSEGTPPYTYLWSNGETSDYITNLESGWYSVTVSDSCGFLLSDSILVNQPDSLWAEANSTGVNCAGGSNGMVSLHVSGGMIPYSYLWSNGQTTAQIEGLNAGIYYYTVTDACADQVIDSILVTEPELLVSSISGNDVSCFGAGDGSATVAPAGGTPPYIYLWNIGQNVPTAIGLFAGNYSVNVTDANNCLTSNIITISEPDQLQVEVEITGTQCNRSVGTAEAVVFGGTLPYQYNWSSGGVGLIEDSLSEASYSLSIADANGCTNNLEFVVPVEVSSAEICMVMVDPDEGKNMIIWEKQQDAGIAHYIIYKAISSSVWNTIGTVPASQEGMFIDYYSDPKVQSDKYYLVAVDSCGHQSLPGAYHKTINMSVTANTQSGGYSLIWNHYEGFSFERYIVYRGDSPVNLASYDTVPFDVGTFIYNDIYAIPGETYFYMIAAEKSDTCMVNTSKATGGPYSHSYSNLDDNGSVYIGAGFNLDFSATPRYISSAPYNVAFENETPNSAEYTFTWLFGDGSSSTAMSPYHTYQDTGLFDVTLIAESIIDGERDTLIKVDYIYCTSGTAIDEFGIAEDDISVFPNPASNSFIIKNNTGDVSELFVNMINTEGQTVYVRTFPKGGTQFHIETGDIAPGLYIIRIVSDNRVYNRNIVIH